MITLHNNYVICLGDDDMDGDGEERGFDRHRGGRGGPRGGFRGRGGFGGPGRDDGPPFGSKGNFITRVQTCIKAKLNNYNQSDTLKK